MMSRRIPIRRRLGCAAALAVILLVPLSIPTTACARDLFPGYPDLVRAQAERVVSIARPGNEAALSQEVRLLRVRMHGLGILSMNAIPDLLFARAVHEGWKKEAAPVLRAVREVAPFSVPMWAWLVKEDVLHLSLPYFLQDLEGLTGSMRRFGPALIGYAAWLISIVSAGSCWFVIWGSISLFLRARPSLEGEFLRLLRWVPAREYLAPMLVVLVFVLPLLAGFGLAVTACFWLALSAGYLRRGEFLILVWGIVLLSGVLVGGGILQSLRTFSGGWLGAEGSLAVVPYAGSMEGQGPLPEGVQSWMARFEKARSEMQAGHATAAERLWTSLIREKGEIPEALNNRGIARAQQGRIGEALSDFEAAISRRPQDGPALWNAYQAHLRLFNLEQARRIQPESWEQVQRMAPLLLRPSDMEAGEWIASPMPVREIWNAIFRFRGDWIREAGESEFFAMFFHPLSPRTALLFLAVAGLFSGGWKLLSRWIWVHGTCRACGNRSLVVRARETSDICTPCRVKIGGGIRAGEERNRRVQGIVMHRRYVVGVSFVVPGAGALWAGKGGRALVYGMALSLALGALTSSLGGGILGEPLVSELQRALAVCAAVVTGLLWAGGAAWGMRSFSALQRIHNVAGERI